MIFRKSSSWCKLAALLVLLSLIAPLLVSCGNGGVETSTPTSVPTSTTVATPTTTLNSTATPTPTATPSGPIKIGVISVWSGPMALAGMLTDQAIAVVENQVKNMGGILGGREVKFVKGDTGGATAQSVAQAKKLTLDDKVAVLTVGGASAAQFTAVAEEAEALKIPYIGLGTVFGVETKKYSICQFNYRSTIASAASSIIDLLKPKTVVLLAVETEDVHVFLNGAPGTTGLKDRLTAAGINFVSEQYFSAETQDFSPYLTKIKYQNPDLVISYLNSVSQAITINKQIGEQGGWGSMKYLCVTESAGGKSAIAIPSAVGTYVRAMWMPGSDQPGMKAFEDAFVQTHGRVPTPELALYYNNFWTAIKAIELAGTDDHDKVAQAMRSGNLEWDSAWGPLHIASDGIGDVKTMILQIQKDSKLVKVWP